MAAMKGLPTTVAMTKVQRIEALRNLLDALVQRLECVNPDEPDPLLRTYRVLGSPARLVDACKQMLSEEDDRATARAMKDQRKAKREAATLDSIFEEEEEAKLADAAKEVQS